MKDVARRKFKWNEAAVPDNLDKVYPGITIKDLNNYKTCGRKYTDISSKTHDKPDNRKDKTKTGPNSYFKLIFGMEKTTSRPLLLYMRSIYTRAVLYMPTRRR